MTAIQARPLPGRGDALPVALSDLAASMNWSPPSAPSRAVESPLGRVGRLFFEASRAIVPEADRRQARLLASLNFLLIFVYAGGEIAASMYAPEKISPSILPVLACSGLLSVAAYGFSRTRHIGAAIIVSLSVQWITPLAAMLADAATESVGIFRTSAWLALSMLLAIGTATLRAAVVLAAAALVLPVVGALLHLGSQHADLPHTFVYVLSLGGLTVALTHHRSRMEHDRSAELRARNAELIALGEHLAARRAELRDNNKALAKAYADLQKNQESLLLSEKMASLGRLTAGIAHEMGSPLAAVRAALAEARALIDEYERSIGDPDVTDQDHHAIAADVGRSLQLADKAAERASSFVRNIKARTRDVGAHERAPFDAVLAIRDALQMLGHEVTRSKSRVAFDPEEERMQIVGFPGKLSQIVTNLVSNALDANHQKGGGAVRVGLARAGGGVVLTVSDEGPGIAPADLPRIFEPLFTTKPIGQGTGLGLTIVHDIVYGDFRGHIDVGAAPGGGAQFTVHLPAEDPT